jgi:hypothetical protein
LILFHHSTKHKDKKIEKKIIGQIEISAPTAAGVVNIMNDFFHKIAI